MEKVRAHLLIEGRVQGVFFRASTLEVSREEGVTGWVRNKPGGDVEALLEGDEGAVKRVIQWCRNGGPPMARVDDVEVVWGNYTGEFDEFSER